MIYNKRQPLIIKNNHWETLLPSSGRQGYAPVEVLISSVLFIVVLFSIYSVSKYTHVSYVNVKNKMDLQQDARAVIDLMKEEIFNIGFGVSTDPILPKITEADTNKITFWAVSPDRSTTLQTALDVGDITFNLDSTAGLNSLDKIFLINGSQWEEFTVDNVIDINKLDVLQGAAFTYPIGDIMGLPYQIAQIDTTNVAPGDITFNVSSTAGLNGGDRIYLIGANQWEEFILIGGPPPANAVTVVTGASRIYPIGTSVLVASLITYERVGDILTRQVGPVPPGETLIDTVKDFEISYYNEGGGPLIPPFNPAPPPAPDLEDIRRIQITLTLQSPTKTDQTFELTSDIRPRNL